MVISDYYKTLDEDTKKIFRERVLNETGISYTTFYYKLRQHNWSKAEEAVIKPIIRALTND